MIGRPCTTPGVCVIDLVGATEDGGERREINSSCQHLTVLSSCRETFFKEFDNYLVVHLY